MATVRWRRLARRHFERRGGTDTMMARVLLRGTTTVVIHPCGVTMIAVGVPSLFSIRRRWRADRPDNERNEYARLPNGKDLN